MGCQSHIVRNLLYKMEIFKVFLDWNPPFYLINLHKTDRIFWQNKLNLNPRGLNIDFLCWRENLPLTPWYSLQQHDGSGGTNWYSPGLEAKKFAAHSGQNTRPSRGSLSALSGAELLQSPATGGGHQAGWQADLRLEEMDEENTKLFSSLSIWRLGGCQPG